MESADVVPTAGEREPDGVGPRLQGGNSVYQDWRVEDQVSSQSDLDALPVVDQLLDEDLLPVRKAVIVDVH
jgi:hypothetical protein